jgi:protein-disulfide isomerase
LRRQVDADRDLGLKMGLTHTPTIFVVTQKHWIDVANVDYLDEAIQQAESLAAHETAAPVRHTAPRK